MANVAKAREVEITTANKRGAKGVIQGIREKNASLRRLVADLRRRVFVLERENKGLNATIRKFQLESAQKPDEKSSIAR